MPARGWTRARGRRLGHTSSSARHAVSTALATIVALAGLSLLVVGAYAWAMPVPAPTLVGSDTVTTLGRSPWFTAGSTLFVTAVDRDTTVAADWGCRLTRDGAGRALGHTADRDALGTRVVEGQSLDAAVVIGPTHTHDSLVCDGPAAQKDNREMWVLPTDPGMPKVPMSMVVGGFALLGAAGLIHPRGRGLHRFGR